MSAKTLNLEEWPCKQIPIVAKLSLIMSPKTYISRSNNPILDSKHHYFALQSSLNRMPNKPCLRSKQGLFASGRNFKFATNQRKPLTIKHYSPNPLNLKNSDKDTLWLSEWAYIRLMDVNFGIIITSKLVFKKKLIRQYFLAFMLAFWKISLPLHSLFKRHG